MPKKDFDEALMDALSVFYHFQSPHSRVNLRQLIFLAAEAVVQKLKEPDYEHLDDKQKNYIVVKVAFEALMGLADVTFKDDKPFGDIESLLDNEFEDLHRLRQRLIDDESYNKPDITINPVLPTRRRPWDYEGEEDNKKWEQEQSDEGEPDGL